MSTTLVAEPATTPSTIPTTPQGILDAVRAVLPVVAEEAEAGAAAGTLTPRVHEALRAAGAYTVGFAARLGGPEMSLADQTRMVEMIATVDAGTAWNVTVLAATGFYAGRLSPEAYAELYPTFDVPTCGSFHPKARAVRVPGGYRVTGRWNFGSGIGSADRVLGGVEVHDADGPVLREDGTVLTLGVWLPVGTVELLDDWDVVGLEASSSRGYRVTDVFVPGHHSFDRFHAPRADVDPLNKHVDLPFYSMAGIAVGVAQHALDLATEHLAARAATRPATERQLGLLGEAASYVRAARYLVLDGVWRIDEEIFTPGRIPPERVMARGDAPLATEFARTVVDRCADVLGSSAIYTRSGFGKVARDLIGISAHGSTWRSRWIDVGRTVLADHTGPGQTIPEQPIPGQPIPERPTAGNDGGGAL